MGVRHAGTVVAAAAACRLAVVVDDVVAFSGDAAQLLCACDPLCEPKINQFRVACNH